MSRLRFEHWRPNRPSRNGVAPRREFRRTALVSWYCAGMLIACGPSHGVMFFKAIQSRDVEVWRDAFPELWLGCFVKSPSLTCTDTM